MPQHSFSTLHHDRFKGVMGQHRIVSVSTARTAGRQLGPKVKKSKGERVEEGQGLIYKVCVASRGKAGRREVAAMQHDCP